MVDNMVKNHSPSAIAMPTPRLGGVAPDARADERSSVNVIIDLRRSGPIIWEAPAITCLDSVYQCRIAQEERTYIENPSEPK